MAHNGSRFSPPARWPPSAHSPLRPCPPNFRPRRGKRRHPGWGSYGPLWIQRRRLSSELQRWSGCRTSSPTSSSGSGSRRPRAGETGRATPQGVPGRSEGATQRGRGGSKQAEGVSWHRDRKHPAPVGGSQLRGGWRCVHNLARMDRRVVAELVDRTLRCRSRPELHRAGPDLIDRGQAKQPLA
jgi:hypothetical protein